MPQILNKYSFGADLGTGIGQGISKGLEHLTKHHLQGITWNKAKPSLNKLGFNDEEVEGLQSLYDINPELTQQIISNRLEAPAREQLSNFIAQALGISPETAQELGNKLEASEFQKNVAEIGATPQQEAFMNQGANPEQAQYLESLSSPFTNPLLRQPGQQPALRPQPQVAQPQIPQQNVQPQPQQPQRQSAFFKTGINPQQALQLLQIPQMQQKLRAEAEARQEKHQAHEKGLIAQRAMWEEMLNSSEAALKASQKANFGTVPSLLSTSEHTRGKLDKDTAAFDAEATKLANLKTQLVQQGRGSDFLRKQILREKPSLGKSKEENQRELKEIRNFARQQLQIFDKENPSIKAKYEAESPGDIEQDERDTITNTALKAIEKQLPAASLKEGQTAREPSTGKRFVVHNGEWRAING